MTSYLYFDCGCSFEVDEGRWDCSEICDKHYKELCKEDLNLEND